MKKLLQTSIFIGAAAVGGYANADAYSMSGSACQVATTPSATRGHTRGNSWVVTSDLAVVSCPLIKHGYGPIRSVYVFTNGISSSDTVSIRCSVSGGTRDASSDRNIHVYHSNSHGMSQVVCLLRNGDSVESISWYD